MYFELVVKDVLGHEGHAGVENAICPAWVFIASAFSKRSFSLFLPEHNFFSAFFLQEHVLAIASYSPSHIPLELIHESFIDTPGNAGRT